MVTIEKQRPLLAIIVWSAATQGSRSKTLVVKVPGTFVSIAMTVHGVLEVL